MAFSGGGEQRTDKGVVIYAPAAYAYSDTDHYRFHGERFSVSPGDTTVFDLTVPQDIRLSGGSYWVQDPSPGDAMTFQVVDVDNILGGGHNTVVTEYVTELPVAPWNHHLELSAPTAAFVPAGLYLRISYTSTGGSGTTLGVTYRWFVQT